MKKHFLKSFALLAMLFSAITLSAQSGVDWSVATSVIGTEQYKVAIVSGEANLQFVNNIQKPGFASEEGIHIVFTKAITECSLVNGTGCATEGGGMIMYLSALTARETKVIVKFGTEETILWVYNANGTTGGSSEPVVVESNYCQTPLTSGTNTIYLTCEKVSEGNYQIVIEGEQIGTNNLALATSGSHVLVNNEVTSNITKGSLLRLYINTELSTTSKIICEIPSTVEPTFDGPLYVNMPGEVNFGAINNIVWGTCPEPTEDNESPVMTSASVVEGSITHNSVQIAVAASDNVGVTKYVIDDKSYTATDGKITVKDLAENTSYTLTVYAQDAAGNKSATGIDVTFTTTMPLHVCFGSAGHFDNPTQKKVFYQFTYSEGQLTIALKSLTGYNLDFAEVQIIGVGNIGMTSDGNGGYTHSLQATENSTLNMLFLYSDTEMPGNQMTAQNLDANDANIISYYVGGCEPVAIEKDVNFALASNGASATASSVGDVFVAANAIDGNSNTRWASVASDPQWLIVDFGQRRVFNTVKLDHEGAWIKTFDIAISDDGINFVPIKSIVDQTATLIDNHFSQEIYLGADYTARYVKMDGKARGTGYGYSLWEFEVYYPGTATLTSIECTASDVICKVGETLSLTSVAKDQHGNVMNDQTFTYTVTPADAGSVEGNTYKALKFGDAKIIATCGELTKEIAVINYAGDNVALSTDINTSKIVAQSDFAPNGTDAWHAIDGNEGSVWQGSATNGGADDEASRTYNSWFVVDFGAEYDINLVTIQFEGACSQEYTVDFSVDNAAWVTAYKYMGNAGVYAHTKLIYGNDLQNNTKVRYARFYSTKAATQWGVKMFEFKVFGTESASPTKAVSASVNDAAMGTATVTQDGVAVTEVATGSEVTFTATANEGYLFLNWSNGNTNPSFTTTVDAAMNLTANFRALGNIYCNTEMTVDGHTIYVTMKRSAPETYQLIVRSEENLTNFGGTNFYRPNNEHVINLRDQGVLSDDKHILTATFTAETIPYMVDPLFVIFEGIGEKTYPKLDNIEYDVECSEDVTVTGLALDPASVSIMVGASQTLKAIFTPAHAFGEELEWISSSDAVATVDANGLVTAVAEGEAVITATLVSNPAITATCNVTVTKFTAHTFYGYNSDGGVDFAYSLTSNADGTVTIVADVLTNNLGLGVPSFSIDEEWKDMTKNADGTYTRTSEKTFSIGQTVNCFLYAPYTGGVGRIDFTYTVGSENTRPAIPVTGVSINHESITFTVGETIQLSGAVTPMTANNKTVTWKSSNEAVATVVDGLVTAIAPGNATITITSVEGNYRATCSIKVLAAISELPPAPIWHKSQVKAIYSATYDADCDFGEWASGTIYTQDTYGKKFTTNTTGYFGLVGFVYDCTDMQHLHLDVWCANSTTLGIVPIHGGAEVRVTKEIIGGQWNAIEIPLTAYEGVTDWSNVTQLKIDQIKEQNIWLNNVYFYKEVHQEVTGSLEITEDYAYTSLTITEDGKVTISNSAKLIVKDFIIKSTMGAGESGQLLGATIDNFDVIGDAYIDITLGGDAAADQWHAFTVPFPVNALNGIYKTDGTKLRNEVDYAIMDYHGDIRANGKYGWKKYHGDLVPGTFYIMTVNGDIETFRFKKTDGSSVVAANNKDLVAHNGSGEDTDKGWNGVGNPTLAHGSVAQAVQVLNPETYTYETHEANATNFTVGTPFFIQAAANGSMTMEDANALKPSYAPARQQTTDVKAKVYLSNENYTDRLYIHATDDATTTYEIGKDLVKMTMTNTPSVPQLFARAYNTDLCMIHTPLSNDEAVVALNLYAPADGEYTLSAEAQNGETIYLLKDNAIVWDLTASEYTIYLSQGNTEVYGVAIKRAPQVETGVNDGATIQTLPSKVILQGNLYILHNGQVYDAMGKCVK